MINGSKLKKYLGYFCVLYTLHFTSQLMNLAYIPVCLSKAQCILETPVFIREVEICLPNVFPLGAQFFQFILLPQFASLGVNDGGVFIERVGFTCAMGFSSDCYDKVALVCEGQNVLSSGCRSFSQELNAADFQWGTLPCFILSTFIGLSILEIRWEVSSPFHEALISFLASNLKTILIIYVPFFTTIMLAGFDFSIWIWNIYYLSIVLLYYTKYCNCVLF